MNKQNSFKKNGAIFLYLLLVTAVFCLRASCFSPMNSLIGGTDAAMFYMCGKAWYHGLIPYIDFVDVKGPLLFFIFLTGQLITPDNTDGIFILQCISISLTLLGLYQTSFIFTNSSQSSVIAAIICLFIVGRPSTWCSGCQSELFIIPFAAWSLYTFVKLLYSSELTSGQTIAAAITTGIGAAAGLLIKYNTILPFLTIAVLYGGATYFQAS